MKIESPWSISSDSVLKALKVSSNTGLENFEVESKLKTYGPNIIFLQKPPHWTAIFFRQFNSFLVGLLAVAALVSWVTGDALDAFAILLVLIVNALIGFITEFRALRSMESLRKMGQTSVRVLRSGDHLLVTSENLVPGDIIVIEAGDVISADCRIIKSQNLIVDESTLTGESVPVEKDGDKVFDVKTIISDRQNMLMKGTHISKGSGLAVVINTGMNTELGIIANLTSTAEEEVTPLEKRLDRLGKKLVWLTLFVSVIIFFGGLLSGKALVLMVQTAIALAVATVPEGLPIVATIALARGLWTMAKENALINKLSAVETLGATSIIVTDKTGTLTENKMVVSEVVTEEGTFFIKFEKEQDKLKLQTTRGDTLEFLSMHESVKRIVEVSGLCNDAKLGSGKETIGDPMEVALLEFSLDIIGHENEILKKFPRLLEIPFDTHTRMMSTFHKYDDIVLSAVKGAPEAVISNSNLNDEEKKFWKEKNNELAVKGLRVLAFAYKEFDRKAFENQNSSLENLNFLGLIGLIDPARQDVPESVRQCHMAGIRVIMATGDQAGTAMKIAEDIGLPKETLIPVSGFNLVEPWSNEVLEKLKKTSIFSRVSPEQKLQLVKYYQNSGYVVAMTGDGVNDAPALKKADIGVAMGFRGTQVAKEAADMILKDDRFETIVFAIRQGRIIFANIRKFVIYLLSCNISEVLVVGAASIFSSKLPVTPLQILFLNLVTDVFPALALGMGKGDSSYLSKPPRSSEEKIIEKSHWHFIFLFGGLITVSVTGIFNYSIYILNYPFEKVVTVSFLTLGISQIFHVFNLRKSGSGLFFNDITKNPHIWGAVLFCLGFFLISVNISIFQKTLNLVPLSFNEWLMVFGCSLFPLLGQFIKRLD